MAVDGVNVEVAHIEATKRLVKILKEQYAPTLTSLFTRDTNLVSDSGAGVFLPDLDYIWRQAGPTEQQLTDMGLVAAFVGPSGDSSVREFYTRGENAWDAQVATPYAVSIIFGVVNQEVVDESWVQGEAITSARELRQEEMMYERAYRYLGALKHVITKYGCRHSSIHTTEPLRDYPTIETFRIGEDQEVPFGVAYYEFNLIQYQRWPLGADL